MEKYFIKKGSTLKYSKLYNYLHLVLFISIIF